MTRYACSKKPESNNVDNKDDRHFLNLAASVRMTFSFQLSVVKLVLPTVIFVLCLSGSLFAQDETKQKGKTVSQQPASGEVVASPKASGGEKKKVKTKIVKYPDAKVWTDVELAAKEFPGFEFVGEFIKGEEALQITPAEGKFYLSRFQGGLPGAGWDGNDIFHQWVELSDLKKQIEGWQLVNRSEKIVGKQPPKNALVLFDGSNVSAWNNGKMTSDGLLKAGVKTKQTFKDFHLYFEYLVPLKPEPPISHPHRGNSGVFALGAYEVQIADTFGLDLDPKAWQENAMLKPTDTWCGSIYGIRTPSVNMCLPPLAWQSMEIEFKAAQFADGKKVSDAVISVIHNGVKVHDKVALPLGTGGGPSGPRAEVPAGPISFQNHGNPNLFRNVWIVDRTVSSN